MRRAIPLLALTCTLVRPCAAQSLSEKLGGLFQFTACDLPLCLTYGTQPQATHYTSRAALAQESTLDFFTNAVSATLGGLPLGATTSGQTFRFVDGAPVSTTSSAGPIFAERAQTLGRGRILVSATTTRIALNRVRGTNMRDVVFNFDHEDLTPTGALSPAGVPLRGDPVEEYDVLEVRPWIRLALQSTTAVATYGLTDRIDVGVAVPLVAASLRATATASFVSPRGPISGLHLFGTNAAPTNSASAAVDGSHTGIGDVAVRAKANLRNTDRLAVALLGDVRLPTGSRDDFAGTGHVAARAIGVLSARAGGFSPHANVGFAYQSRGERSTSALLTAGFDQLAASWATIAADVISDVQLSGSHLTIPAATQYLNGMVVPSANVPDRRRDDPVSLSLGTKLRVAGATFIVNGLLPLTDAGLQASRIFTFGIERTF